MRYSRLGGALEARTDHLVEEGLARRQGQCVILAGDLMATLRDRDVDALAARLAEPYAKAAAGEHVTGIYKQRFSLASGRFAMIDDGFGFQLVP